MGLLVCAIIAYKISRLNRLLAPRIVKKEPQIEDFMVHANVNLDAEGGPDINLNPVVQARFLVEADERAARKAQKRGAFAYGALRKLKLGLSGEFLGKLGQKRKGPGGLSMVDVALEREAQEKAKAEAEALEIVQEHLRQETRRQRGIGETL